MLKRLTTALSTPKPSFKSSHRNIQTVNTKMPTALCHWLRKRLRPRKAKASSSENTIPILPAPRPHALSPSPSRGSQITSKVVAATANCAFYQRLSPDLRRVILIQAFGGRNVHMDLSFDYPIVLINDRWDQVGRDVSRPKAWQWFSSVCHLGPGTERCYNPRETWCCGGGCGMAGDSLRESFLGVTGWIQTCRQAYVDGVEILYGTNTFRMASSIMIYHLSDLLLPQRLAIITSVEMVWPLHGMFCPEQDENPLGSGKDAFNALLQAVPESLPNLHKFNLCLVGPKYMVVHNPNWQPDPDILIPMDGMFCPLWPELPQLQLEDDILIPVDCMFRALGPQLLEFNLALPHSIFQPRWEQGIRKAWDESIKKGGPFEERRWKFAGKRIFRHLPLSRNSEDTGQEELGYWLREGLWDVYDDQSIYCFGSQRR